jgi:signal transduction histidine kinase
LRYSNNNKEIELSIKNDGKMPSKIIFGNGLSGIKERIDELKGRAEFSLKQGAFITDIHIPVPQDD